MTPEERLEDLENWLYDRYNGALRAWAHAESPGLRDIWMAEMKTLEQVARRLITTQDGPVPLFEERLIPFTQHLQEPEAD